MQIFVLINLFKIQADSFLRFASFMQLRSRASKTPPAGGVDTAKKEDNDFDDDDEFGLEDIEDTEP